MHISGLKKLLKIRYIVELPILIFIMEPFEYVVVLTSLIIGLGITQIITGTADIISNIKNVTISYSHSLLVMVVFILLIQEWWYSYQYANQVVTWTLPLVLFLLVYPISLYTLARMIFPTGLRGHETDLEAYYYEQWPFMRYFLSPPSSVSFKMYSFQDT